MAEDDAYEFDVALSFAGEDRQLAEEMAELLLDSGIRVFYDRYEQANLWGKDLYQHLQTIYRDRAKYCVIFTSKDYAQKLWTKHELRQAQARAFSESSQYILPLRVDDTDIPGMNHTVGYVDLRRHGIQQIADMLIRKVQGDIDPDDEINWKGEFVDYNGAQVAAYWPRRIESAQSIETFPLTTTLARIRYGSEGDCPEGARNSCHDCAVVRGQYHVPGCDVEQCPRCGGQLISCGCDISWHEG